MRCSRDIYMRNYKLEIREEMRRWSFLELMLLENKGSEQKMLSI